MNKNFRNIARVLFVVLFCVTLLCVLNRTGSLILTWKELPIGDITHDSGNGYYAYIPDENVSKLDLPIYLVEDGEVLQNPPLSVNEDRTAEIKLNGGGSYTVYSNNDLYFSASDNDPESHEYSVLVPEVIRMRWLLILLFITAGLDGTLVLLERKNWKDLGRLAVYPASMVLALLLIPWNGLGVPLNIAGIRFMPVFQRNVIAFVIIAAAAAALLVLRKDVKWVNVLAAVLIAVNLVYYFVPEWNYFGLRTDSFSYIEHHTASSIRTIGYPAFIEAVNDEEDLDAIRGEFGEELYAEYPERLVDGAEIESHGLLKTVRAQKVVLAAAFLLVCSALMYASGWAPCLFFAELVLCGGFLGVDNSYIMSECLSQAVMLGAAACFIVFAKDKKAWAYLLGSVLAAAAVLVRPSNILLFALVLFGALVLILKKELRGRIVTAIAGIVLYFVIAAIPAVEITAEYGRFLWMPVSSYAEMGRALSLMDENDKSLFTDTETSAYVDEVLAAKEAFAAEHEVIEQNDYVWTIAVETAEQMGYDRIECSWLFAKVSRPVIKAHFNEFVNAVKDSFLAGIAKTQLKIEGLCNYPTLILLALGLLFWLGKDAGSILGILFVVLHNANVLLSAVNQPEKRYIFHSEILFILGLMLILKDLPGIRSENRD